MDEFDSIIEERQTPLEEKNKILGLISSLLDTSGLPIKMLLTMAREPGKLESTRTSSLMTMPERIRLRPLKRGDFDEMITGITGSDMLLSHEDLDRLFELSGGWPYFAKLLLTSLSNPTGNEIDLDRALAEAVVHPNARQALEGIYQMHFDRAEKTLMLLLAKHDGYVEKEEIAIAGNRLELNDKLKAVCPRTSRS